MARPAPARLLVPVAAAGVLTAACSELTGIEPPSGTPYARGPVTAVTPAAGATHLLVRPGFGAQDPCGLRAGVTSQTRVLRRAADGTVGGASLRDVAVGDTVEVYVDGFVADSCPAQAQASAVVLLPSAGV